MMPPLDFKAMALAADAGMRAVGFLQPNWQPIATLTKSGWPWADMLLWDGRCVFIGNGRYINTRNGQKLRWNASTGNNSLGVKIEPTHFAPVPSGPQ